MKKFLVLVSVAFLMIISSCTTIVPVHGTYAVPAGTKCHVLGRVKIETSQKKSGYNLLMDEALRQYPNADDVVDILVDAKATKVLFWAKYTYIMSGVVVDYE